jgi:hypothetical protein
MMARAAAVTELRGVGEHRGRRAWHGLRRRIGFSRSWTAAADLAARRYGQQLRARGKKGGVIGCAVANRANKIAYAMVRDQSGYDPDRWA